LDAFFQRIDKKLEKIDGDNHHATTSIVDGLVSIEDTVYAKLDSIQNTMVDNFQSIQAKLDDEVTMWKNRSDHFEQMTYTLRDEMEVETRKKYKRMYSDLKASQSEIAQLKAKVAAEDQMMEMRFGRVEASQAEINEKLDKILAGLPAAPFGSSKA
jgi:hypothetical protein